MELKLFNFAKICHESISFNRTFMELKYNN